MSILPNAQNTIVQGSLTAVAGNQHIQYGGQYIAGDQHNYNTIPLQGIDLLHQHFAPTALLDAKARLDQPKCMEGTREAIIGEIMDWVKSGGDVASMKWLQGPAGSGKTAIGHTIAHRCKMEGDLIGSFFFSRAVTNCTNGDLLIPTLSYQLSTAIPRTKNHINDAINKDRTIFTKDGETQLEKLFVEPLRRLSAFSWLQHKLGVKPFPRLILIDGLDECSDRGIQCEILAVFGRAFRRLDYPIRIIIASRPEPHILRTIENMFSSNSSSSFSEIDLKEDALARRDIRFFFETKFAEVRRMHNETLTSWPGPGTISQLVDKASGQFIFASTVMAYIASPYHRPDDRLHVILNLSPPPSDDTPFSHLDFLYSFILRSAKHLQDILRILALLVSAKGMSVEHDFFIPSPLDIAFSTTGIEQALSLREGDVKRILTDVHSLVDCQPHGEVTMLHASLPDFLTDQSRSKEFFIGFEACAEARAKISMARITQIEFSSLSHSPHQSNPISSLIESTSGFCESAGLSHELHLTLQHLDLWGKYESLFRKRPWRRASATAALKENTRLISEYLGSQPADLDLKLHSLWDEYTWNLEKGYRAILTGYRDKMPIRLQGSWAEISAFVVLLSNRRLSLPTSPPYFFSSEIPEINFYKKGDRSVFGITFTCILEDDSLLTIATAIPDSRVEIDLDLLKAAPEGEQEARAWQIVEKAYFPIAQRGGRSSGRSTFPYLNP